jgi:predicted nucleotidyltransferase
MGEKPRPLSSLDPLQVPLPHGTEVTLRVDQVILGKRVPRGAVGRVFRVKEGEPTLEVMVVGVGVGTYRREDLLPRKDGQLQFAMRRSHQWDALMPCRVLEATVGSRAWGLSGEGSDTDLRGLFALPFSWTLGLLEPPADLVSLDGSATYWEIGKAIQQALRSDPNTLELLFVPNARPLDELGEWVLQERQAFVSAQIFGSFGQYALAQLRKLQQSARLAEHRAVVLEWLREEPAPSLDEVAQRLTAAAGRSTTQAAGPEAALLQAKEYVKQLYRSLYDQGLLGQRDFESLKAFARTEAAQLELPRELRPKNAYNLIRLIATATDWLRTGEAHLEVSGALRERLLAIKRGEVPLHEVLVEAEAMTPALEEAHRTTRLPERPDASRAHALLVRVGREVARRSVLAVPGPFGADAPEPPAATWSDQP